MAFSKRVVNFIDYCLILLIVGFIVFVPFAKSVSKKLFLIGCGFFILSFCLKLIDGSINFRKFFSNLTIRFFLFFIISALISSFFSSYPTHSLSVTFERYLYYFIIFLIGYYLISSYGRALFFSYVFIFIFIYMCYGALVDFTYGYGERLVRSFGISVNITQYIILYLPFAFICVFFSRDKFLRIIAIPALVVGYFCLLLNASRMAWVGVFCACLVFMGKKRIILFLLLLIAVILLLIFPFLRADRFAFFDSRTWGDRLELWKTAFRIFIDHPIIGAGTGMFEKLLYTYGPKGGYSEGMIHLHAHSTYLEVLSEMGIIGLVSFIALLISGILPYFRLGHKNLNISTSWLQKGLLAGVLSTIIIAFTSPAILIDLRDSLLFWLFFGMVVSIVSKPTAEKMGVKSGIANCN